MEKATLELLYEKYLHSSGVCTDTRSIKKGCLFFALKGPNFNANEFAEQALEKGAVYVIVDDKNVVKDDRFILVKDTLIALQELAAHHRSHLKIPVIALTGSNGKTTTKELLYAVLSAQYKTHATVGNLNNHIGVPLTILAIREKIEMLIIEMGANKIGDIEELCEIAQPTHGLITNIGKAHLEGFGGIEGVKKGKGELYTYLKNHEGMVFINANDSVLIEMGFSIKNKIEYGKSESFLDATLEEATPFVKYKTKENKIVSTHLVGAHLFNNILAALAIGTYFDVSLEKAHEAIANYIPSNNRSQIIQKNNNTILLDAYNANPSSMQAALESFNQLNAKKKCVILGDMFELGNESKKEHERIGEILTNYSFDLILLTGKEMEAAISNCPKAYYFPDPFSLRNWLTDKKITNYFILIKGSRGMKLEQLVDFI